MHFGRAIACSGRVGTMLVVLGSALAVSGCASDNDLVLADAALDTESASATKAHLIVHAHDLATAANALCASAPQPAADGWVRARDGAQIEAMKKAWRDAHAAYEGVAGAVDVLLPELGAALDTRYDGVLESGPDGYLFDDLGFVGLHAVERILWADRVPKKVVTFESSLAGYVPAAFPADQASAMSFRDQLCARLIADTAALEQSIGALELDSSPAYETARRLGARQLEKLVLAGQGRDESRYSDSTLAQMAAGLTSAETTYAAFHPWLMTKSKGPAVDATIDQGFAKLQKEYAAFGTDGLPWVPAGWSTSNLTGSMLETPFGQLFAVVTKELDESSNASLGGAMNQAAKTLGIDGGHKPAPSVQIPKGDGDDY